jgi:hypothetical protein
VNCTWIQAADNLRGESIQILENRSTINVA